MQLSSKLLAVVAFFSLAACSGQQPTHSNYSFQTQSVRNTVQNTYKTQNTRSASFLSEKQRTAPPFGYVDFCRAQPAECPERRMSRQYVRDFNPTSSTRKTAYGASTANRAEASHRSEPKRSNLSRAQILNHLQKVNNVVNNAIKPVSDMKGFGVAENWRIPNISSSYGDIGDCEDYALLKRKILAQHGFNYNDLSMAVVRQANGEAHAVLVVRTDFGDYVLDNIEKSVKAWNQTNYAWIKKQSIANPFIWVSVS